MKVTISSDGTPHGTRVTDEGGNDLSRMLTAVSWSASVDSVPEAHLELAMVEAHEVKTGAKMYHAGREVRAIEYADGERVEFD
jgi:hypothetical protein